MSTGIKTWNTNHLNLGRGEGEKTKYRRSNLSYAAG